MTLLPRRAAHWHRPLLVFAAAMAVLAVVTAVGVLVDDREVTGARAWLKPFKFAVSFVLYAGTLAWLLSLLPRRSRIAEWATTVVLAVSVVEMSIIVTQVVRGRPSHFNASTPLDENLFDIMGAAIMVLFLAHLVLAVRVLRGRIPDRTVRYAVVAGMLLALLGMLAAVPMTVPTAEMMAAGISGAHSVGVPDGGPGMPVTGWSTTGGDLRIGHFIGLHGLQVLPLLGLLLHRSAGRWAEATRVRLLLVAAAGYAVLTAMLTGQALRGQPLLRPDALTLAGFAALVLGTAVAVAAVLAADRHRPRLDPAAPQPATDGMLVR
ncbi:hypothetical protein [Jidongwangia harbinensis]|uniref:hypothetical protein n=1 Tax=Jidongwangia harbinensis TaxID=2878561 RepID=UPI001CD97E0B|nr:hypothetical protein [Jidongwangia harbinensis]MCA2217703.1 hypothetical protein [Jidongwangia harbinensis]